MKNLIKPLKVRIAGSNPVDKWINLVKRWNSCADDPNNPFVRQRMVFTKAEVYDLVTQYPSLLEAIYIADGSDSIRSEMLDYADYNPEFKIPINTPKALIIDGLALIDYEL